MIAMAVCPELNFNGFFVPIYWQHSGPFVVYAKSWSGSQTWLQLVKTAICPALRQVADIMPLSILKLGLSCRDMQELKKLHEREAAETSVRVQARQQAALKQMQEALQSAELKQQLAEQSLALDSAQQSSSMYKRQLSECQAGLQQAKIQHAQHLADMQAKTDTLTATLDNTNSVSSKLSLELQACRSQLHNSAHDGADSGAGVTAGEQESSNSPQQPWQELAMASKKLAEAQQLLLIKEQELQQQERDAELTLKQQQKIASFKLTVQVSSNTSITFADALPFSMSCVNFLHVWTQDNKTGINACAACKSVEFGQQM